MLARNASQKSHTCPPSEGSPRFGKIVTADQLKRFERWRRRLPQNTSYLVSLIVDNVVPMFQARGFDQYSDYAGGNTFAVGSNCIPLQRRSGPEWPTTEILFDKRSRPGLGISFAMLPEICRRFSLTEKRWMEIQRLEANVAEGPAVFSLCKGHAGYNDRNFGYYYMSLSPTRKLRAEVDILKSLLPWLFDLFDRGIPQAWLDAPQGYVDSHAFLILSWNVLDRKRSSAT
jgi:hypothetical protein